MIPLKPHRNITFKRVVLDMFQFFRTQRVVTRLLGKPFRRSDRYIELDITYKCNLKCCNCNRSCTQAPSAAELSVEHIGQFLDQSIDLGYRWERIRILGGEPTLHPAIFEIADLLLDYRNRINPNVRLVLCTNGHGRFVNAVLKKLPPDIIRKSTKKTSHANLFRPFNRAPIDSTAHRFSDFSSGCRIIEDCGLGFTPQGYYICAIAGAIDRVFGIGLGRKTLPSKTDSLLDQCRVFCPLCGHFGFIRPTRKQKVSPTWQAAYQKQSRRRNLSGN